jgi:uncharacterized RDD family membrane protein YckC
MATAASATSIENARCARHPDAPALLVCARCGDFACHACASIDTRYCSVCQPAARRRVDPTRRLIAVAIDSLSLTGIFFFIAIVPGLLAGDSEIVRYALIGVGLLGLCVYSVVQWRGVARSGQSIGKRVMGLRLVRPDGSPVSVWTVVLLRNGVIMLVSAIPIIGGLFGLVNLAFGLRADGRCLHDHLAGTVVIHARESA